MTEQINKKFLVSAIIIFLNAEKFIEEAIESVFAHLIATKNFGLEQEYQVWMISYNSHNRSTPLPAVHGEERQNVVLAGWGSSVFISHQADMI